MLCASAAPDVPGLIINATRYMSIHDRKPELPGQPGVLHRGERASRVGGKQKRRGQDSPRERREVKHTTEFVSFLRSAVKSESP